MLHGILHAMNLHRRSAILGLVVLATIAVVAGLFYVVHLPQPTSQQSLQPTMEQITSSAGEPPPSDAAGLVPSRSLAPSTQTHPSELKSFEIGTTTETQVLDALGPPYTNIADGKGDITFMYYYIDGNTDAALLRPYLSIVPIGTDLNNSTVYLTFDEQAGIFKSYASTNPNDCSRPLNVSSIHPSSGPPGTLVTITGNNFNDIILGLFCRDSTCDSDDDIPLLSASSSNLSFQIPTYMQPGLYDVHIFLAPSNNTLCDQESDNAAQFTVTP
jgi:IPT/TIG domain